MGCDTPSPTAVETEFPGDDGDDDFYSCPFQFVPDSCWEWYNIYKMYLSGEVALPKLSDLSPRYLAFRAYFKMWDAKFFKIMHPDAS